MRHSACSYITPITCVTVERQILRADGISRGAGGYSGGGARISFAQPPIAHDVDGRMEWDSLKNEPDKRSNQAATIFER